MIKALMIFSLLLSLSLVTGCADLKIKEGTSVNGVVYYKTTKPPIEHCAFLGTIAGTVGHGGAEAITFSRVDALNRAQNLGATHFYENPTDWITGIVTGVAYSCRGSGS